MNARRWLFFAGLALAAAAAGIFALTEPRSAEDSEAGAAASRSASAVLPSSAGPPTPAPAPQPDVEARSEADGGEVELQPPGSVAQFANPDDRADSLQAMQRQRFDSAMDALNRRAARRAAMAPPPTGVR